MKPLVVCVILAAAAQPPRPRSVGAAADSRGNTVAWVASGVSVATGPLPGVPASAKDIVGAWTVGGGSSTRSYGQADLNSDSAGIGLQLLDGGAYKIQYSATLIMGAFVSATKVEETGKWNLGGGQLIFTPDRHDGWISVMSGKKQPVTALNPPARTYSASVIGDRILLRGRCLPYQVDPYCGSRSEGYAVLDFPLRRSTPGSSPAR